MSRIVSVFLHPEKPEALEAAAYFVGALAQRGFITHVPAEDRERLQKASPEARIEELREDTPAELAVVFGGDGSVLRAAAWALPLQVPVLGVNLGHVGFLAELETSDIDDLLESVTGRKYSVEKRTILEVKVHAGDELRWHETAINEVSLEKAARERMLTVMVGIDGRPLSRWGCDGVLVSTPTGSTAYAFSAGGPVVWPDVAAILVVPLSAHALFNRPMVLSPRSHVTMNLEQDPEQPGGVLWCDGRANYDLVPGEVVTVTSSAQHMLIARMKEQPFTTRLVKKFALPVQGWGRRR